MNKINHKILSQFFNKLENYHIYFRKELAVYLDAIKINEALAYPYIYKN
jgi:hypothetical protein